MSNVLLIWEEIPEETKLYLIPSDMAIKYKGFLESAHGNYINTVDWENHPGLMFLNAALSEEGSSEGIEEPYVEYLGVLAKYKVDVKHPLYKQTITEVYLAGFIL